MASGSVIEISDGPAREESFLAVLHLVLCQTKKIQDML
jgi:hypothetical protein